MRRRDFISLLGGMTTIAWPRAGLAQNVGRRRAIVLMGTADDVEAKDRAVALQQGLQKLGWTVGRDIQIDYLFAAHSKLVKGLLEIVEKGLRLGCSNHQVLMRVLGASSLRPVA